MEALTDRLSAALRRFAIAAGLMAILALLLLGAAGFGVAALHLFLATELPEHSAAAMTAAALVLAAAVVALLAALVLRRRSPPRPRRRRAAQGMASAPAILQSLPGGPWERMAFALVAGVAVGVSPELRRELVEMIRRETRPPR